MNLLPQAKYIARCKAALSPGTFSDKNCLVVGGTQGIGRSIAVLLSSLGANVTIAGRSNELASNVLSKLRNQGIVEKQKHSFEKVDLASQKDTRRFIESTSTKLKQNGGLDYLFLTAGKPPNGKQSLTTDGIEAHFALQCLGRYSAAYGFSSVMNKQGHITVVCAPGGSGEIPQDDCEYLKPGNKERYGLIRAAMRDSMFVDSVLIELAKKLSSKQIGVLHLFPGTVSTNAAANAGFPWPIPQLAATFGPWVMTNADEYAYIPVYEALNGTNGSYQAKNQWGSDAKPATWTTSESNRVMCVDYAERRISEALQA